MGIEREGLCPMYSTMPIHTAYFLQGRRHCLRLPAKGLVGGISRRDACCQDSARFIAGRSAGSPRRQRCCFRNDG